MISNCSYYEDPWSLTTLDLWYLLGLSNLYILSFYFETLILVKKAFVCEKDGDILVTVPKLGSVIFFFLNPMLLIL